MQVHCSGLDQIPDQKAAIEYDPTVIKNRRLSTTTTQDITVSKETRDYCTFLFCRLSTTTTQDITVSKETRDFLYSKLEIFVVCQ